MACLTFLSENLINDAQLSITTGTENAQYPLTNIKNDSTTYKFRSVGDTVVIEVDLLQTREIDTIAVVGDATKTLEITAMSVKTSATTDFSGSTPLDIDLDAEFNIGWSYLPALVNHRFVEITLTGNGTFAEVSNIFIGKRVEFTQIGFSIQSFRYRHNDPSKVRKSDFGQKFIDTYPFIKRIVGTIEYATQDEQETLDDIFLRHGRHSPLWVIVDPQDRAMNNGKFKLSIYTYMEKMPSFNAVGNGLYNCSLELDAVV